MRTKKVMGGAMASMPSAILVLIFMLMSAAMPAGAQSVIEEGIAEANRQCPISLGSSGEVTSIVYSKGYAVYTYNMSEEFMDFDALQSNPSMLKQSMMTTCKSDAMRPMIELLAEYNGGMKFVYIGKTSGKVVSVSLTPSEVKSISNSATSSPEDNLREQIKMANIQMPMKIAEGMTSTGYTIEGGYVVLSISMDENLYSISSLRGMEDQLKENIKQSLSSSDATIKLFVNAIKNAGYGLTYKYYGATSGETVYIRIRNSEL